MPITQQQSLTLLDVVSSLYVHCRDNNRRDWYQCTIFEAITLHSLCAFSKPQIVSIKAVKVPYNKYRQWT